VPARPPSWDSFFVPPVLAGDATDTREQLHARRADAISSDPDIQRQPIDRIVSHAREHPTVYLPSHDRESAARLAANLTLQAD